jgi:hypothetical protein
VIDDEQTELDNSRQQGARPVASKEPRESQVAATWDPEACAADGCGRFRAEEAAVADSKNLARE